MQEKYHLVSFIIPCYNHEKYVVDTLNSILADDYPNKEIIIINDGSKDRSDNVISDWISNHQHLIKIIYKSRENLGICKTLNELISLSSGKYIVIIASDDMLYNGSVLHRVKLLEQYPNKLVVISDAEVIDENNQTVMNSAIKDYNLGDKGKFKDDFGILLSTLVNPQISGPSLLVDRKIYDIVGQYKENLIAEDWYFYQRAAAKNLIIFDDNISGRYRIHGSNISAINNWNSSKMAKTIVLTYWYNWSVMPGLKFKSIACFELLKWVLRYLIYKIKY